MSGPYDKPPGGPTAPPPPSMPRTRTHESYYSHPISAPPETHEGDANRYHVPQSQWQEPEDNHTREQHARDDAFDPELRPDGVPARKGRRRSASRAAVVPAGSVTSRSLTLVVAIMCFLACLTAGFVYMVNQSASAWLRDVASEVTVQIEPKEGEDIEKAVRSAAAFLAKQSGIRTVKPLNQDESAALVEPWLGKSDALKSLPIPRLIAIEINRAAPPDLERLRGRLATELPGAILDDHRHWQQQIRTVTRSLALGGLGILMLVGAATTAIIISATRSSMASNREIVEVLHLVGATDRYIAREFERHFLRLGVRAGLVGAGCAMLVFLLMPTGMELLGGNVVTMAEMRRLFGAGVLDLAGYGVLVAVVIVIAALCMLTSRFGVYSILETQR